MGRQGYPQAVTIRKSARTCHAYQHQWLIMKVNHLATLQQEAGKISEQDWADHCVISTRPIRTNHDNPL
jgi:hypothetical protein